MKIFIISDTHFGHNNILNFTNKDGTQLRKFKSIIDHDELMIENWNKVVSNKDKVYHLGDVGFFSFSRCADVLKRLNGTKILIKGNHDHFKLSQYQQYFKDIRASHILDKFILTHIPIHPESLYKWRANIHGHVHTNSLKDNNYFNTSVEVINYTPINFEVIREYYK